MTLYNLHMVAADRHCSVIQLLDPSRANEPMTVAEMNYLVAFEKVRAEKMDNG